MDARTTFSFNIGPRALDAGFGLITIAVRTNKRDDISPNAIMPIVLVQGDRITREALDETLVGCVRLVHAGRPGSTALPTLDEDRASLGRRLSDLVPRSEFRLGVSSFVNSDLVKTIGNLAGFGWLRRCCYRVDASKEHDKKR